ncbi:MAG: hypothetical protein SZ59_C0002G0021 [candidate division TM6 bacterium GW2011_GWF2_28_16]|nr:MAG: hypothetical protein SZ59_C0002G0021 [candidate division TM6 bacterium GW2011_GWF2_28_16]
MFNFIFKNLILILFFNNFISLHSLPSFTQQTQLPKTENTISDPIINEKETLKKEESKLYDEQIKFALQERNINNVLNNIQAEFTKIDEKLRLSTETEKEFLVKFITFLNEKKQVLLQQLEIHKDIISIIEQNIKNIKIIISYTENPNQQKQSSSYSWKEFQEASKNLYNQKTEKSNLEEKIKTLEKQQETESKFLASNNNQKEKVLNNLKTTEEEIENETKDLTKIQNRTLLKEELSVLNEVETLYKLKIRKLKEDALLKNSMLKILSIELENKSIELQEIEKNLIPTSEDVNIAQQEWSIESQKTQIAKDSLEEKKAPIKKDLEVLIKKLDTLKEKEVLKEIKDQTEQILLETQIISTQAEIDKINNYLKIIEYEKNRLDLNVISKKLQFDMIKAYYQSNLDNELAKTWLDNFKNQKEIAAALSGELDRKINEEINVQTDTIRRLDQIKAKIEDINLKRTTIFRNKTKLLEESLENLSAAKTNLAAIKDSRSFAIINDQKNINEQVKNTIDFIKKQLSIKNVSKNIWHRSTKAISIKDLKRSFTDAENFLVKLFWDTPKNLSPYNIFNAIKNLTLPNYLGFLISIIFFILFIFGSKKLLLFLKKISEQKITIYNNNHELYFYLYIILDNILTLALNNFKLIFSWLFIYLHIFFDFKHIFSSIEFMATPYLIAVFYLSSIPIWIYLSGQFLAQAKELNKKLSFIFFAEKTQPKFMFLLTSIIYSTAILIPLRQAFLNYIDIPSIFPNVMLAAYSLILVAIILFFFSKEDVLTLIPQSGSFFLWLRKKIEKYYYPVFIFLMGLLILSNPYIGYSNLAWYLAFAIPVSAGMIYSIFLVHYYIRKWFMPLFLKEENEDIVDTFEQSKIYYGFFIILTFLALSFVAFIFLSKIWQLGYSVKDLIQNLSQDWTIPLGQGTKFGIIEFLTLISFILSGFLISNIFKKFIFNKLFEIFRTEPGTQNTIFKIAHYIIITLAIIFGFATIKLKEFITIVGSFMAVGIGFALKDLVSDYVAGLFILIERPIEIGNFIQLDEKTIGTVQKISARATTIRTARNFYIIIPNRNLISHQITNWGDGRMSVGFELKIQVDYGQDLEKVKAILQKTVQSHEAVLRAPAIVVRIDDLADNGVLFFIRAFISARKVKEQWEISSQIRFAIMNAFKENNILIPYPQIVVHKAPEITK